MSNVWNMMNRLPAEVKRKTNEFNCNYFAVIHKIEQAKNINRTPEELKEFMEKESHDVLLYYIKRGYFYSTLNGLMLMDDQQAKKLYKKVLVNADLEYANSYITVWFNEKWEMLKDVYNHL